MLTPEQLSRIAHLRAKVADDTITKEELREAVVMIREGRLAAGTRTEAAQRAKAKKEIPSADDMLSELMGE